MIDWVVNLATGILGWLWSVAKATPGWMWKQVVYYARQHPYAVVLVVLGIIRSFGTTVQSGQAGVLFSFGRAKKVLEPGFHPLIPVVQQVRHTPVRSVTLNLPRQRVTTGDGLVYDVLTSIVYRVEDPIQAAVAVDDVRQGVTNLVPLLVHELLREQTRETLSSRQALDQELTIRTRQALSRWGLQVETAGMSTIAPTRPTVRLTQLPARVRERQRLLKEVQRQGLPENLAAVLTTGRPGPLGHATARYRRHRPSARQDMGKSEITVILPRGGELTVGEVPVTASGSRTFETPRLEKDKPYFYTMKVDYRVHGIPLSETRTVEVKAGQRLTVDFTKPAPETS